MLQRLQPHWRSDAGLPARIDSLLDGGRRLGSRDRRLYRELLYTTLRHLPWLEPLLEADPNEALRRIAWLAADSAAARPFRLEVAAGLPDCPASAAERAKILGADVEALSPEWLASECPEALRAPMRDVLLSRAPLWLRLQAADASAALLEFERLGWAWHRSPLLAGAIELPAGAEVVKTQAYLNGDLEVQDVGSQLILESVGVRPGGQWLDACAGAGGKTLQLAVMLGAAGSVTARDPRHAALQQLAARAARAGLEGRIRIASGAEPRHGFDGVLVDAPCSGSGTWRRAPHLRWVTSPASLRMAASLQRRLLQENAPRVRPGGLLVYATCSLCRSENESVVEAFLSGNPGFVPEIAGRRLAPQDHDGDGYFVASFRRTLPGGPLSSRP